MTSGVSGVSGAGRAKKPNSANARAARLTPPRSKAAMAGTVKLSMDVRALRKEAGLSAERVAIDAGAACRAWTMRCGWRATLGSALKTFGR